MVRAPQNNTGFCVKYGVGNTTGKGLGVFAREPIKKGRIVWRHVPGTFVVFDEQSFRKRIRDMTADQVVYELTHVHAFEEFPGCLIRALDDGILINHSSEPNLATNKDGPGAVSLDESSVEYLQRVSEALVDDRYSLVATRNIESGEELANDYSADDDCPPYYDELYEQFGIREDFYE